MALPPSRRGPAGSHRTDRPRSPREPIQHVDNVPERTTIIERLREAGAPLAWPELRACLGVLDEPQVDAVRRRLRAMCRDGELMLDRRGRYALVERMNLLRGRVELRRDGSAQVAADDGGRIHIDARHAAGLQRDDVVLVRAIAPPDAEGVREGVVVEVVDRSTAPVTGRYFAEGGLAFVEPEGRRMQQDIVIQPGHTGGARNGDYVRVALDTVPGARLPPTGRVVEVLGGPDTVGVEREVVLDAHGIVREFPDDALAEARTLPATVQPDEVVGRIDLRAMPLVTIDGEDARDFDDAVYAEALPRGAFRVVVAIADVSHYVGVDSALDRSALERGNSVYLPGHVTPMLPEAISNELCSLKPRVDRLCMVCDMHLAASGKVTGFTFCEGVMHSAARLTYGQVGTWIAADFAGCDLPAPVVKSLRALHGAYGALRRQREKRGALDFDSTETRIEFNAQGRIAAIVPVVRTDAHRLIEECMIAANVCAAEMLAEMEIPALSRRHDPPPADRLEALTEQLASLGLRRLPPGRVPQPGELQAIVNGVTLPALRPLVEMMILRSLSQACYAPGGSGHFGLALGEYTHFTSPIRRYPDLMVHRAIRMLIRSRRACPNVQRVRGARALRKEAIYPYTLAELVRIGEQNSQTERRAEEAERDMTAWLKCAFMLDHVGEEFAGVVAGVAPFGLFIDVGGLYIQGMLHVSNLGDDYYEHDPARMRLVGDRTGRVFAIGDAITVVVASVDLGTRRIELLPSGASEAALPGGRARRERKDGRGGPATKGGQGGQGGKGGQAGKGGSAGKAVERSSGRGDRAAPTAPREAGKGDGGGTRRGRRR